MAPLPNSYQVKLERAEAHLDALERAIREFRAGKPYRVTHKDDWRGRERIYYIRQVATPDPAWSAILGDCVHNFRSALDHLAWHIVTTYSTGSSATEFPLTLKRQKYRSLAKTRFGRRAPTGLKADVERLQPYKSRSEVDVFPLWVVHRLDIIDKHRQLNAVAMAGPTIEVGATLSGRFRVEHDPAETRIMVPFAPPGPVKVKVEPAFQIQVPNVDMTGGDVRNVRLPDDLRRIRDAVTYVGKRLRRYC